MLSFKLPTHIFPSAPFSLLYHNRGMGLQLGRTGGVMTTYFVTVDSIR
jgi:hypothetical protein